MILSIHPDMLILLSAIGGVLAAYVESRGKSPITYERERLDKLIVEMYEIKARLDKLER